MFKKIAVLLILSFLVACQSPESNTSVELVSKSHSGRDMGVAIAYPELSGLEVGDQTDIDVTFSVSPNQSFDVALIEGPAYLWGTDVNTTLQANEEGQVTLSLNFVAQKTGRQYLKFLCTLSGDNPVSKVFSIPFSVEGGEQQAAPDKVMLPAKQF